MSEQATDRSLLTARLWAAASCMFIAALVIGGWCLFEFDMALVAYGMACVLSTYAFVFRFTLWCQRPPTQHMYRRAFNHLCSIQTITKTLPQLVKRFFAYFGANRFVAKRGLLRWFAHWPIMMGCVMAASIAFPLVFGWVWFQSVPENLNQYQLMIFHFGLFSFETDSFFAFMLFHGLVWASFPVLIGVGIAFVRRMRNRGDQAVQTFAEDFMPLIALAVIAITGLLLATSYTWFDGAGYDIIALSHAVAVIGTILWLPFSKLLHVPQRSLKVAEMINAACDEERHHCQRCGGDYARAAQIADLKSIEAQLGFLYADDEMHYQDICPACRRANFVLAQGQRWKYKQRIVEEPQVLNEAEVLVHG